MLKSGSLKKKIITVVGARPQFVKAAVISRLIKSCRADLIEKVIHTGQHYDKNMSDLFFDELDIPDPAFNLGIGGGTHGQNTGRMIEKIESILLSEKPDRLLVYGDTDSTLAATIAACKLQIPIAHIEAGLRSFNQRMPEEINRILTDQMSDLLFAPSEVSSNNLRLEGIKSDRIKIVGDIMCDAARYYSNQSREPSFFSQLSLCKHDYALCTIHRAENLNDVSKMQGILNGLKDSALNIIWPLHPRTKQAIADFNLAIPSNIKCVNPVSYLEMVWLIQNSRCIATDSGGVQKEAYFHRKPCVTLREETEWVELIELGCNTLASTDPDLISKMLTNAHWKNTPTDIYGNGDAGERILKHL